jgi:two-component system response regulator AtoC
MTNFGIMNNEQVFNIFVVEDNEWYNKLLIHTLSLNPEYTVQSFFSGEEMMKQLTESVHVITLDYRLPDTTGDVLLKQIKEISPNTEVIIISFKVRGV